MTNATDFLLDDDGDLQITSKGDFKAGESDGQHITHIMIAYPGYYRQSPLTGVGIRMYEKSAGTQLEIQRLVRIQLEADRYLIDTVKVNGTNPVAVSIKADRIA